MSLRRGISDAAAVTRLALDVMTTVSLVLSRPFALLTQVLTRKSMGERYFTPINAAIGLLLIGAAAWISKYLIPVSYSAGQAGRPFGQPMYTLHPYVVYGIGIAWMSLFLVAFSRHRLEVERRYAARSRWHSRNSGLPRLPFLLPKVEYVSGGVLAATALYFGLYSYGLLAIMSVVCNAVSDQMAASRFWASVLDAVDAEIEAENLSKAVAERLSPELAEGLEAPVPAYVSPEGRKKVAETFGGDRTGAVVEVRSGLLGSPITELARNGTS